MCVYVLYVFMILSMILEGSLASAKRLLAERLLLYSLKVGHKFLDMKDAPIWPHPPHILDGTVSAITDGWWLPYHLNSRARSGRRLEAVPGSPLHLINQAGAACDEYDESEPQIWPSKTNFVRFLASKRVLRQVAEVTEWSSMLQCYQLEKTKYTKIISKSSTRINRRVSPASAISGLTPSRTWIELLLLWLAGWIKYASLGSYIVKQGLT